jgi:hypothetical protein
MRYQEWIEANVSEPYGKCAEATAAMLAAFPELRRVRGHYHDGFCGERAHWWLVAPDGTIVDPTHAQFPDIGGAYVEHDPSAAEPTGLCMTCGGYCYGGAYTCSDACEASNAAHYGYAAGAGR